MLGKPKKTFFYFVPSLKKHILFKGFLLGVQCGVIFGYRDTKLLLNMALLVQKLLGNFYSCQNPFSAILRLKKKSMSTNFEGDGGG